MILTFLIILLNPVFAYHLATEVYDPHEIGITHYSIMIIIDGATAWIVRKLDVPLIAEYITLILFAQCILHFMAIGFVFGYEYFLGINKLALTGIFGDLLDILYIATLWVLQGLQFAAFIGCSPIPLGLRNDNDRVL